MTMVVFLINADDIKITHELNFTRHCDFECISLLAEQIYKYVYLFNV